MLLMIAGTGCSTPPSDWPPPRFRCPTVEDEAWLRGVTPEAPVDAVANERGRRFVRAAAYCRRAGEELR